MGRCRTERRQMFIGLNKKTIGWTIYEKGAFNADRLTDFIKGYISSRLHIFAFGFLLIICMFSEAHCNV